MGKGTLVLIGLVLIVGAVMMAGAAISDNAAQVAQAQALIETNRTAQIGMTSQAIMNVGLLALVGLLVLLNVTLLAAVIWMAVKRRNESRGNGGHGNGEELPGGKWKPGPNALWGKNEKPQALGSGDMVQQLVQLEVLKTLKELRGGAGRAQLPPATGEVDDDGTIRWDG